MPVDVLLGLQWGDEGKGKIVDVLSSDYAAIARFQGGPNAGHTLEFDGQKHVLHTIPSGIFHDNIINIVGNGVVIDPVVLRKEVEKLISVGVDVKQKLLISKKAQIILPTHRLLDAASEKASGEKKIGSTLKGIGPTYKDKAGRTGIRVGQILHNSLFDEAYQNLTQHHKNILRLYSMESDLKKETETEWFDAIEYLKNFQLVDSEIIINNFLNENKNILAEGAQGSLLDIDFGSYPYVTSSNTISAGACTGLGVAPNKIRKIIGIFKAYCTRVGGGPFPTEQINETGELLRKFGNEYGATTGRPRRCGWLDLPALKYAIMLNGATELIMTKGDILSNFNDIKICTHYQGSSENNNSMFNSDDIQNYIPVYKNFSGWKTNLQSLRSINDIPEKFKTYIGFIEKNLNVPITYVGVGPDRNQILQNNL